jgi:hypothetical protein
MQDVTERICSTHKVESLSLVGGLDGHIHQDKPPVENQPSPTVQPASLQTTSGHLPSATHSLKDL